MLRLLLPLALALLAGCGQKGPLYLPASAPVASVPATPAAGTAAETAETAEPAGAAPESRARALPATQP